jgi:hypothetical protein
MTDNSPTPPADAGQRAYQAAAREGRLILGLCRDTGRPFFYPRASSPFTLSPNVDYVTAAGAGTIYSVTVARGKQPYALALVELAEGPRILTNIVDCDLDALHIGQEVRLVWRPKGDGEGLVAMFTPLSTSSAPSSRRGGDGDEA